MTEGLSKELLTELYHVAKVLGNPIRAQVLSDLIDQSEELDPWLPIENAPLNKLIRVFSPYAEHYGQSDVILAVEDNRRYFTKYKELPEDPKEINIMQTGYIPQPGHKFTVNHPMNKELICVSVSKYWVFAKNLNGVEINFMIHSNNFYPL